MRAKIPNILRNTQGLSLIEIIVTVAIGAIISITSAYISVQAVSESNYSTLQADINRTHYLNLQKLRTLSYVQSLINASSPAMQACINGKGNNCTQYSSPKLADLSDPSCAKSPSCNIKSNVTYSVACSSSACTSINLDLKTSYSESSGSGGSIDSKNAKYTFRDRTSSMVIPTFIFNNSRSFDFTCATGAIVTGLDLNKMIATCQTIVGTTSCVNLVPMASFAEDSSNCQKIEAARCANGFSEVGVFSGQGTCTDFSVTPPGPTPTPTPKPTPTPTPKPTPTPTPKPTPTPTPPPSTPPVTWSTSVRCFYLYKLPLGSPFPWYTTESLSTTQLANWTVKWEHHSGSVSDPNPWSLANCSTAPNQFSCRFPTCGGGYGTAFVIRATATYKPTGAIQSQIWSCGCENRGL